MKGPEILEKEQILLLGVSFFGDPFAGSAGWTEENEIGRLWNRFSRYLTEHKELFGTFSDSSAGYEVHIEHHETAKMGHFEVFVGMEIKNPDAVPYELLVKVLPASTYAVFTLKGEEITSDWEITIGSRLKELGYRRAHTYSFQYLDRRFKGIDKISESELDVYVPVTLAGHE